MKSVRTRMVVFAGILGLGLILPGCEAPEPTRPDPVEKPDSTDKGPNESVRTAPLGR